MTRDRPRGVSARAVLLFAVVGLAALTSAAAAQTDNSCIDCHAAQVSERLRAPAVNLAGDVHAARGFSCQDCHGGDPSRGLEENDPKLAHDRSQGYIGAPERRDIPDFCGRCHADVEFMKTYNPRQRVDQLLEYASSHHGKALAAGDLRVATCVSCHGVHGILPVSDSRSPVSKPNIPQTCGQCHANTSYMRSYGIPTDQVELYSASVHGRKLLEEGDLGAPACNTCHGNHGATPPGLTAVSEACGECHANNREYFNQSPHKEAFAEMELGECITCHNYHEVARPTDAMVGTSDEAVCMQCHEEGDGGYRAAAAMSAGLDSLKFTLTHARELLDRAERGGVDVKLGKFDLHAADDALIKARTAVHYFELEKFRDVIGGGLSEARNVIAQGEQAMQDLKMRRVGLAFTIPLILWVALALYLKVRSMEREKPLPGAPDRHPASKS